MNITQTTWPDDVLARYLTAGQATVDITTDTTTSGRCETGSCTRPWDALDGHPTFEITLRASCTGTGCADPYGPTDNLDTCTQRKAADLALFGIPRRLRTWAQDHAQHCRAMPHPTT
ncbi:hypothetical protein ACFXPX_13680 [Kitasatospora sp. NPDC059146]|uniref:hypothetical protein n=1 Tax=Kitasatospora sp. NPDC059146 TaxID=3346741 RepID=UPI00369EA081